MHREIKMAEGANSKRRAEGDDQASKSAKAIRLLREVTTLLSEEEAKETLGAEETTQRRGASNANAILNDFRSIFAPYQATQAVHRVPLVSTFQSKNRSSHPKQKRGVFFQPKDTWTHEFFCLSQKIQDRVPSRAGKFELQAAGLGRRRICFHSKANFAEFSKRLEEEYPKLKSAGGFVLMRTGVHGNNCLATIMPPRSGYSVPFLRDCSGLGQAMAYIRPLQRDLDTTPVSEVRFLAYFCGLIIIIIICT